ncbi:hypothetical protein BGX27_003752 [Mortierella sp. AM989]|nr:hypothetical protein BGX27_003752 [Mortierella sp. AM989]
MATTNHPGTYTQYASWNTGITSSTAQANEVHLTPVQTNSVPDPATSVSWVNGATGGANTMQMQCTTAINNNDNSSHVQRQSHIQRPKQGKNHQLQVMTSLESGFASMYPQTTGNGVDAAAPNMAGAHNIIQSSAMTSAQRYHWSMAPSPVESNFNSGSSTPSFASMSPSLSYANSELGGASCNSSRPTSPLFNQSGLYDGYLSERRLRKLDSESSSQIIRSRKSSTSSTSSSASQRRMSMLRESTTSPSSPLFNSALTVTSTIMPTNQCPTCGQCFAGPAVLVRHIESIHEKLLWNCVGCKSNLSRRDAVTRHINLSPMDSVCRAVGTIGQIKMINGNEIHYEISSYRAKPLDEVMNRMGKKISPAMRREIDLAKARNEEGGDVNLYNGFKYEDDILDRLDEDVNEDEDVQIKQEEPSEEYEDEAGQKKRRRPSVPTLARKK